MHLEILVEDQSGKRMLDRLVPVIVGGQVSFRVIPFKGIGRIPKDLARAPDPRIRTLLHSLPSMLRAYGRSFPAGYLAAVIVVCDLDDKCLKAFRRQLLDMLGAIHPRPRTRFCLAIEEGEAWLLGDIPAIIQAYPRARTEVLHNYTNDSICGTWELLANAVYPGGATALKKRGWQAVGMEKSKWANNISPRMNIEDNASPSFQYFREATRWLSFHQGTRPPA